jgi:hypothetical protein
LCRGNTAESQDNWDETTATRLRQCLLIKL